MIPPILNIIKKNCLIIMHKSIIIFIGLLAFLLPIAPSIGNSNVMAFEDYGYEADQYEQYAKNMANDSYYYKSNSDLIQKIKCNNINSNLNGIESNVNLDDALGVGSEVSQEGNDVSANEY
jgi:hypothetical protein